MAKNTKKQKHFLDRYENPWQRTGIIILLCLLISCLTFAVLFGADLLFGKKTASAQNSPSSSAAATITSKAADVPTILPETTDAGRSYLDETLFLGDSNTVRFMAFNDASDGKSFTSTQNTIAVVGMGVQAISTLNCEQLSTGTYTMVEAVSILQPRRIFLTFGTNNLDGKTKDSKEFITTYTQQVKSLQEAYPSADIIINSIPPVAEFCSYDNAKPFQIEIYNNAIIEMCNTNGWKYLDSYSVLVDESTGYAKYGYTAEDGLHLSQTGVQKLFDAIRTHAYITEDSRPKPLAEIPTIYGPKTDLYYINPLNNQTFSEDVLHPSYAPETTAPASTTDTSNNGNVSPATASAAATLAPTAAPASTATAATANANAATVQNATEAQPSTAAKN